MVPTDPHAADLGPRPEPSQGRDAGDEGIGNPPRSQEGAASSGAAPIVPHRRPRCTTATCNFYGRPMTPAVKPGAYTCMGDMRTPRRHDQGANSRRGCWSSAEVLLPGAVVTLRYGPLL